jgi:metal-responsive CopG/Arc/MetJ family transcriptional regulator
LRRDYTTVKIPAELAAKLDALISQQGYHSRAEVVNDAIRRFMDERRRLDEPMLERATQVPLVRSSQE